MEYLEGLSLGQAVTGAPIDEAGMLSVMRPIIDTVAFLHSQRINHLDIKPDNIVLADSGTRPVLIDFGQSKHFNADGSSTSTIKVKGATAGFAPVEQYDGITTFSPTVDVYALGATMMMCLTGTVPPKSVVWQAPDKAHAIEALPASEATKAVIARALAANPADRYPDAAAMAAALSGGDECPTRPLAAAGAETSVSGPTRRVTEESRPISTQHTPVSTPTDPIETKPTTGRSSGIERKPEKKSKLRNVALALISIVFLIWGGVKAYQSIVNSRIEKEDLLSGYTIPRNLYFAVSVENRFHYYPQSVWESLSSSERLSYTKEGIVINKNGIGPFILSIQYIDNAIWPGPDLHNLLPSVTQGEAIVSQNEEVINALKALGGAKADKSFWTSQIYGTNSARYVDIEYGTIGELNVDQPLIVRAVLPIPE